MVQSEIKESLQKMEFALDAWKNEELPFVIKWKSLDAKAPILAEPIKIRHPEWIVGNPGDASYANVYVKDKPAVQSSTWVAVGRELCINVKGESFNTQLSGSVGTMPDGFKLPPGDCLMFQHMGFYIPVPFTIVKDPKKFVTFLCGKEIPFPFKNINDTSNFTVVVHAENLVAIREKTKDTSILTFYEVQLEKNPRFNWKDVAKEHPGCSICFETFVVSNNIRTLLCGHIFHAECIADMPNCAQCRGTAEGAIKSYMNFV